MKQMEKKFYMQKNLPQINCQEIIRSMQSTDSRCNKVGIKMIKGRAGNLMIKSSGPAGARRSYPKYKLRIHIHIDI